jgi:hypothetical protein
MAESLVALTEGSGKNLHTFQRVIGSNTVEDQAVLLGEPYLATYTTIGASVLTTTTASHALQIMAGASLKVRIKRIVIQQTAAAGAAATLYLSMIRLSTAGTGGGSPAMMPADPSDAAAGATAMTLPTVKGTEAGAAALWSTPFPILAAQPLTSRFEYDWSHTFAKPIIIAAGVANGVCFKIGTGIATSAIDIVVELVETNF